MPRASATAQEESQLLDAVEQCWDPSTESPTWKAIGLAMAKEKKAAKKAEALREQQNKIDFLTSDRCAPNTRVMVGKVEYSKYHTSDGCVAYLNHATGATMSYDGTHRR